MQLQVHTEMFCASAICDTNSYCKCKSFTIIVSSHVVLNRCLKQSKNVIVNGNKISLLI